VLEVNPVVGGEGLDRPVVAEAVESGVLLPPNGLLVSDNFRRRLLEEGFAWSFEIHRPGKPIRASGVTRAAEQTVTVADAPHPSAAAITAGGRCGDPDAASTVDIHGAPHTGRADPNASTEAKHAAPECGQLATPIHGANQVGADVQHGCGVLNRKRGTGFGQDLSCAARGLHAGASRMVGRSSPRDARGSLEATISEGSGIRFPAFRDPSSAGSTSQSSIEQVSES
jgi:hypothetical protein